MENKKIPILGITRYGSDFSSQDGECAEVINLYNGYPSVNQDAVYNMSPNRKIIFVHKNQNYKHWISYNGYQLFHEASEQDGVVITVQNLIATASGVVKIESVGNTLVSIGAGDKCYFLYKDGYYKILGDLPEVPTGSIKLASIIGSLISDVYDTNMLIKYRNREPEKGYIKGVLIGALNKELHTKKEDGNFIFPFCIRFAYRLYDGSYMYHSQPYLVIHPDLNNVQFKTEKTGEDDLLTFRVYISPMGILYSISGIDPRWTDIIRSVDFFISEDANYLDIEKDISYEFADGKYNMVIPKKESSVLKSDILNNSNFYLIHSHPVSTGYMEGIISAENRALISLVNRERLPDDYQSHCSITGGASFVYNGKLHLADIKKRLFNGFLPISDTSVSSGVSVITVSTMIKTENGDAEVVFTRNFGSLRKNGSLLPYVFYPDARAYKMYITETTTSGTKKLALDLSPHPYLNGAYYLDLKPIEVNGYHTKTHVATNSIETLPNRMYVSDTNNPFLFPLSQVFTVSSSRIVGMAAATSALSQGQFGQFPLYVFTEDGIWAMEVGGSSYQSQHPVSRHVCNNSKSITQLDSAIAFSTSSGLFILSGSDVANISATLDGPAFDSRRLPDIDKLLGIVSDTRLAVDNLRFSDYLKSSSLGYDSINNRLIIANGKEYSYIYDIESKFWSKHTAGYDRMLNSYPDLYASNSAGVCKFVRKRREEIDTKIQSVFITRPLKLSQDVLKRVKKMILRCDYCQYVMVIYGSRDGENWSVIGSLDAFLVNRALSCNGSPYKYFIVASAMSILPRGNISHLDVLFDTAYTNKIR